MRSLRLVGMMLRYRVAALLLPFFFLAPALHGVLREFRWTYVAGLLSLCACYLVATSLNDVFDLEIDRINHPNASDRPLVTGVATRGNLIVIAVASAVVALVSAAAVGSLCAGLVLVSLVLNVAYSVPPVRLCARPLAAPMMLAFAYVALPYGCGLAAADVSPAAPDMLVIASFMTLFTGRMLLKDFRDRRGDAAYDKRTFLLTYGKNSTLTLVAACLVVGNLLLLPVLVPSAVLVVATESYFAAIGWQLFRLWMARQWADERNAIVLGARMGNAVILTLLGDALLSSVGADAGSEATFVLAVAVMFWFGLLYAAMNSQQAAAAYRG